jgi:pimeloyl-[acyl-carrier protein] synthase
VSIQDDRLDFSTSAHMLADYLANPGHFPDPYPIFRGVRDVEPVHWSEAGVWLVLGHAEGREAFRHSDLSRREFSEVHLARFQSTDDDAVDAIEVWAANFLNMDDPEHAQVRSLVAQAFSPRTIRKWESTIVAGVEELTESLRDLDEFDLLHDYAYRLPSQVTADMVGVPREDHKLFEDWTVAWLSTNFSDPRAEFTNSPVKAITEFVAYLRALVNERRRNAETESDDLITMLLHAEDQGVKLTEHQLLAAIMLLIIAGHETTANLISNGYLSLLRNPEQLEKLRADPSLISTAVEECLRYESPARSQPRIAVADVQIGGATIKTGQPVQIHVGAASHDGRVFDRPDEMDIERQPNNHLSFGTGPHVCLGLHVARQEARYALDALVQEVGPLEIAGEIPWRNGQVRGVVKFPVRRV